MAQLSDDCFAFGGKLQTVDAALATIAGGVACVAALDHVSLLDADGRVLAADVIAPEGFKRGPHRSVEVHRAALGKPLLHPDDPTITALAADPARSAPIPTVSLNDIAALVLDHAQAWPKDSLKDLP